MAAGIPSIRSIQKAVAREHKLTIDAMVEPDGAAGSRTPRRSRPRQEAMTLAWLLTDHSFNGIGRHFGGRSPWTVMNALDAVSARRRSDPEVDNRLKRITHNLLRECGG